jgi:hypothetical protein
MRARFPSIPAGVSVRRAQMPSEASLASLPLDRIGAARDGRSEATRGPSRALIGATRPISGGPGRRFGAPGRPLTGSPFSPLRLRFGLQSWLQLEYQIAKCSVKRAILAI